MLGDVCIVKDCERAVKDVIDHYGQLDVLVSLFRRYFTVLLLQICNHLVVQLLSFP